MLRKRRGEFGSLEDIFYAQSRAGSSEDNMPQAERACFVLGATAACSNGERRLPQAERVGFVLGAAAA
jgi:hypothetical protein